MDVTWYLASRFSFLDASKVAYELICSKGQKSCRRTLCEAGNPRNRSCQRDSQDPNHWREVNQWRAHTCKFQEPTSLTSHCVLSQRSFRVTCTQECQQHRRSISSIVHWYLICNFLCWAIRCRLAWVVCQSFMSSTFSYYHRNSC